MRVNVGSPTDFVALEAVKAQLTVDRDWPTGTDAAAEGRHETREGRGVRHEPLYTGQASSAPYHH